jgi:UDP-N-acetylmuramyl pentapeptide phosphotransferase/UDP-N-acetylglucosamine-1-phosphate transferase
VSGVIAPAAFLAFAASLLVALLIWRAGVLDLPEARSLHTRPTPRGGGLGVLAAAGAAFAWASFQPVALGGGIAILAATAGFAALGLADDLKPVSARIKFAVMIGIALACAQALGEPSRLGTPFGAAMFGGALFILVAVNAANFVDGSDGMLAVAFIPAGLGLAVAGLVTSVIATSMAGVALAAGLAGFLVLNRPPAKVFAGDAGSLATGALYAAGALAMAGRGFAESVWLAPLFILPVLADVLLTLLKRALGGRFSFNPHREHAYQILIGRGWSHARAALAYGGLTTACVLAGLVAAQGPDRAVFWTFWAAVAVLTGLYLAVARRA